MPAYMFSWTTRRFSTLNFFKDISKETCMQINRADFFSQLLSARAKLKFKYKQKLNLHAISAQSEIMSVESRKCSYISLYQFIVWAEIWSCNPPSLHISLRIFPFSAVFPSTSAFETSNLFLNTTFILIYHLDPL